MRLLLSRLVLVVIILPSISYSDEQYSLLGYKCDQQKNLIAFRYFYYVNGKEILQNKEVDIKDYEIFNPWKLIKSEDKENSSLITELITKERICEIRNVKHLVTLKPSPGNMNTLGRCGAHMTIGVEINIPPWYALENRDLYGDEKGSKVLNPFSFEGGCDFGNDFKTKYLIYNANELTTSVSMIQLHGSVLYE